MYHLLIASAADIQHNLTKHLKKGWRISRTAPEDDLVKAAMNAGPDFLVIQVEGWAAGYVGALLRLYQLQCCPHIVLFHVGAQIEYATSSPIEEMPASFHEAHNELKKALCVAIHTADIPYPYGPEFVECIDLERRSARYESEEFLREIVSGVSNYSFSEIVRHRNLDLAEKNLMLMLIKVMRHDSFNDYTHNRRIYYLLDELRRADVYRVLRRYGGGEMFESTKRTHVILINDLNIASEAKRTQLFQRMIRELFEATNSGFAAHFLSDRIPEPNQINDVFRQSLSVQRYKLFYRDTDVLSVEEVRRKKRTPDPGEIESLLHVVASYDVDSDDDLLAGSLRRLFLDILKQCVSINAYFYCCSAINVAFENFCKKYALPTDHSAVPVQFEWNISIEEVAENYIQTFHAARQQVLKRTLYRDVVTYKLLRYIQEHYHESITLDDLAREVNLSRVYVSKKFKADLGIGFIAYLNQYRIERAAQFLTTTDMKVYEVAQAVGFNDPKFFSKSFHKHTGHSPSDYGKQRLLYGR